MQNLLTVLGLDSSFNITFGSSRCHIITLVVKLFTFAKSDLNLNSRTLEIYRDRNERKPVLLDLSEELHYLLLVHEQPAYSQRVFVENIAVVVG